MKKIFSTQNIALMALFTALIAICSWISIPLGPVPFTLQTFAIFVIAGLLGTKRGLVSLAAYILLGLVGVPVFAGFKGGASVLAGPTGGYIVGFILTVLVIGIVNDCVKLDNEFVKMVVLFVSMIIGDVLCFVVGTIWFMHVAGYNLATSLSYCVIPYIIPDIAKMIVAVVIVNRVKKYVSVFGN